MKDFLYERSFKKHTAYLLFKISEVSNINVHRNENTKISLGNKIDASDLIDSGTVVIQCGENNLLKHKHDPLQFG